MEKIKKHAWKRFSFVHFENKAFRLFSGNCLFVAFFRNIVVKTKKEIEFFEHNAYN